MCVIFGASRSMFYHFEHMDTFVAVAGNGNRTVYWQFITIIIIMMIVFVLRSHRHFLSFGNKYDSECTLTEHRDRDWNGIGQHCSAIVFNVSIETEKPNASHTILLLLLLLLVFRFWFCLLHSGFDSGCRDRVDDDTRLDVFGWW